jgi:hypothetical protein
VTRRRGFSYRPRKLRFPLAVKAARKRRFYIRRSASIRKFPPKIATRPGEVNADQWSTTLYVTTFCKLNHLTTEGVKA